MNTNNTNKNSLPRILTLNELDTISLQYFFQNEICAIRVPQFAQANLCDQIYNWLLQSNRIEEYHHEIRDENSVKYLKYGVDRVGVAFNTTYNKPADNPEVQRYFNEALPGIKSLRQACSPLLSPIDHLRLTLDELWPHHANLANFEGKKMFVGIGRIMDASTSYLAETQPHFDSIPDKLTHLIGQYSANIYLKVPASGGELELWDMDPLPITQIDHADINTDWRNQLPQSLLIKPEKGELILINTRRAHAIRKFNEGKRASLQCFIGLREDQSLIYWN